MASTGKIVEVYFENVLETYEHQMQLLPLCEFVEPDPANMQNSGNVFWRPAQQYAPILEGWDLSGQETDIIEETYPAILTEPKNDFVKQRADDMRDLQFWQRRGKQSGLRQATELNKEIAQAIALQGSLFYRSDVTSGYDFVAQGQAIMNERQAFQSSRCFVLNDRDTLKFASDLAGRQTVQGRPEDTWRTGQIGNNVAEFDVYTGSYLPTIAGGATPTAAVAGNQSFKPEGGTVNAATGQVTNVDYRTATIPVDSSAGFNVGDKVSIGAVQAIGLADKNATGQLMTFTIVAIPDGTSLTVYPKPIALDDAALSDLEKAYANVNTTITDTAPVVRLNTDASAKANIFWDKSAVEVTGGTIPAELFRQFDGKKTLTERMSNGLNMYMVYDGNIADMTFRYRVFTQYGVTVANPANCGLALTF